MFYELIKNAFDTKSKTGAEISFHNVLRRNTYFQLRERIMKASHGQSVSLKQKEAQATQFQS